MQLAMLAPYNNLATSVATALMPTLLGSTLTKSFMSEAKKDKEIDKDSEPKGTWLSSTGLAIIHPVTSLIINIEPVAETMQLGFNWIVTKYQHNRQTDSIRLKLRRNSQHDEF